MKHWKIESLRNWGLHYRKNKTISEFLVFEESQKNLNYEFGKLRITIWKNKPISKFI